MLTVKKRGRVGGLLSITRWYKTMEWKYELASEIVVEDGLTLWKRRKFGKRG